jgi:transcriptional regulator with XRE-family HTH domain
MATAAHDARKNRGQRLRCIRIDRELTQEQLAKQAGVTAAQISRYERGYDDPGLPTLDRLLGALGCSYTDLQESPSAPVPPRHARGGEACALLSHGG